MFKFPLRIKPLNRLWNSTGPEQQQIWPFTEIVVDKYSSDAHFNDLYEAIQWKNKNYPNHHITIRFGEGEWVLQPSTRLINLSLVGPGREQATIVFNGDLNVYQPRVPITFRDFTIQANGNATYSVGLFYQGDVSSEPLYCHNLNIQATNGSTGTYGVWLYGGGTIELHNCLAAAYTGGTEWYGLLISAGTCRVYGGGQYYGDTAPASVAGTLQLRDLPDIDANAIVGAGTISWQWVRNGYNLQAKQVDPTGHLHSKLVASDGSPDPALSADAAGDLTTTGTLTLPASKDVFIAGDNLGVYARMVHYGRTPNEHWLSGNTLSWTWASYTGFVTPSTILNLTSVKQLYHSTTGRKFYYRAIGSNTHIYARVSLEDNVESGIMIDDGAGNADGLGANNFVRLFLEQPAATNWRIASEHRTGGGAVTKTTYHTLQPGFYGLHIQVTGTPWSSWSARLELLGESGAVFLNILGTFSWTAARIGMYAGSASGKLAKWDWYEETT